MISTGYKKNHEIKEKPFKDIIMWFKRIGKSNARTARWVSQRRLWAPGTGAFGIFWQLLSEAHRFESSNVKVQKAGKRFSPQMENGCQVNIPYTITKYLEDDALGTCRSFEEGHVTPPDHGHSTLETTKMNNEIERF